MSGICPEGRILEINDRRFEIIFDLNVISKIEEEQEKPIMDVMLDMTDDMKTIRTTAYLAKTLINNSIRRDGGKEVITQEQVNDWISTRNLKKVQRVIFTEYNECLPEPDPDEESDPNQSSGDD